MMSYEQPITKFSLFPLGAPRRSRRLGVRLCLLTAALAAAGCASTPVESNQPVAIDKHKPASQPSGNDPTVATVNGINITQSQFFPPLAEAYGMPVLLNLVQLTLAKQLTSNAGIVVTPADVQAEHDQTFAKLFSDAPASDYDALFQQLLTQRKLTKVEFDLTIETNAYLRKFARPQMVGKIKDVDVQSAYSQLYGENREVRDIELTNMHEVAEARGRLARGEPFEHVATEMSTDPHTAPLGGELQPFSAMSQNIPEAIKKVAFSLPVGQVSDPISTGSGLHLIKVTRIIPPKVIRFEDVKDSVRTQLEDQWMQLSIEALRSQLGQIALQTLHVDQPELARQWKAKVDAQRITTGDREKIRGQMNGLHVPASQPAK